MATIVLVDDDESNLMTLAALLEDEGFVVRTAGSCAEARALLGDTATADVFLLDQHLRDGLGSELVSVIRDRLPHAKIVMMSGSLGEDDFPAGVDACFEKGGAFSELLDLLRGLLVA